MELLATMYHDAISPFLPEQGSLRLFVINNFTTTHLHRRRVHPVLLQYRQVRTINAVIQSRSACTPIGCQSRSSSSEACREI